MISSGRLNLLLLFLGSLTKGWCFSPDTTRSDVLSEIDGGKGNANRGSGLSRRAILTSVAVTTLNPFPALAKCTDIESCREIGDERIAQQLREMPVVSLESGVRYKVLKKGLEGPKVHEGSSVDIIYTVSRSGGLYMYSQGYGNEKIDIGNGNVVKDLDLDYLRVDNVGTHTDIPIGVEQALVGMKRGERRRVEVPSSLGLETSNWQPAPRSRPGKQAVVAYQRILDGFGSQPGFPAPLVWEVEVLRVRS
eukprot:scaffold22589_cov138-Cylindrotheca_fusiformis.AAC.60